MDEQDEQAYEVEERGIQAAWVFNVEPPVPPAGSVRERQNKRHKEPIKLKVSPSRCIGTTCCGGHNQDIPKHNKYYNLSDDATGGLCSDSGVEEIMIGAVDELEKDAFAVQFHLAVPKKMLASAAKIVETGNEVKFSGREGESYIRNIKTGRKIYLQKEGDIYTMNIMVWDGEVAKKCKVVVDSGVAANVTPYSWFKNVSAIAPKKGVKFVGADGGEIGNYGRKNIRFKPVDFEDPKATRAPVFTGRA